MYIENKKRRETLSSKEKSSTQKVFDAKLKFQSSDQEKIQSELDVLESKARIQNQANIFCWQAQTARENLGLS